MYANCSLLWFQIAFWQLQLDRHRLKMSKVAERWAMFFVPLFSLAIDLFIEPLNGLTRCVELRAPMTLRSDWARTMPSVSVSTDDTRYWMTHQVSICHFLRWNEVHSAKSSLSFCPNTGSVPLVRVCLYFILKRISLPLWPVKAYKTTHS